MSKSSQGPDSSQLPKKSPSTASARRIGKENVRTTLPGVPASSITTRNPRKTLLDPDRLFEAALRWQKKHLSSPGSDEPPEEN